MKIEKLKVGDVVMIRSHKYIKGPDLEKHKILGIVTLGDGKTIIEHRCLPLWGVLPYLKEYTYLDEFLQNCEMSHE